MHKRVGYAVGVASDEVRRHGLNLAKLTRLIEALADLVVPHYSQMDAANFVIRRFILVPALAASIVFLYNQPSWMRMFYLPLPQWGIYLGGILGICGIMLLTWVHVLLDKQWSARLQLRNDHLLIRSGPYSRIRRPMYTALFTIYLSVRNFSAASFRVRLPGFCSDLTPYSPVQFLGYIIQAVRIRGQTAACKRIGRIRMGPYGSVGERPVMAVPIKTQNPRPRDEPYL